MRNPATGRPGTSLLGGAVSVAANVSDNAMPDRCEVARPAAGPGVHSGTDYVPAAAEVVYRGPCRVQAINTLSVRQRALVFGERPETLHEYIVAVPAHAGDFDVNDQVRVLTTTDPRLAGGVLRVANVERGSFSAARYLICEVDDNG